MLLPLPPPRVKQVLGSMRSQLPVLSDSEKDMKKELQTINDQLRHLGNGIKQVRGLGARPGSTVNRYLKGMGGCRGVNSEKPA